MEQVNDIMTKFEKRSNADILANIIKNLNLQKQESEQINRMIQKNNDEYIDSDEQLKLEEYKKQLLDMAYPK